jgi:deoxyinosine 3'endonuclease (endonuclease V)
VDEDEARQIQSRLASLVVFDDDFPSAGLIGGVSSRPLDEARVQIVVCVLDLRNVKNIEAATATARSSFPYIPGLRAFQAGPAIIECTPRYRIPEPLRKARMLCKRIHQ